MRLAEDYAPLNIDLSSPAPAWTPELVMDRMVEAFETLHRIPVRFWPKAYGTAWPQHIQSGDENIGRKVQGVFRKIRREITQALESDEEMPDDILDNLLEIYGYQDARQTISVAQEEQPDGYQISRMEEALGWPVRFLFDQAKAADGLLLWASYIATGRSIRSELRHRRDRAKRLASIMEAQRNAEREAGRRAIAKQVAAWANERLAEAAGDAERIESTKHRARIRFEREVEKADLLGDVVIAPKEAEPNMVLSQTSLDRWRFVGARMIAERL